MKRFVLTTLLILALPIAAFAKIEPVFNTNGILTGSMAGISLDSPLTQIYFHHFGADLGTVTIKTGALLSGSLLSGATFSSVGSSYVVSVNPGVLNNFSGGVLFNGTFTSPIGWFRLASNEYELYGLVAGVWTNGPYGTGYTKQIYYGSVNSSGVFTGTMGSGQAWINPEPDTYALFITGLFGIAGIVRKNLSARI